MDKNKDDAMSMLYMTVDNDLNICASMTGDVSFNTITAGTGNSSLNTTQGSSGTSCWHWWQDYYYPGVITQYYPVYVRERSLDNGKRAYEIIKMLKDKKLVEVKSVKQFMELMDALIAIL